MIKEIPQKSFYSIFSSDPHPFLKKEFIDLNSHKVEKVMYLIQDKARPDIGLVVGYKESMLHSHFSAPFGGFHYRHENIYIGEIEQFIDELTDFLHREGIKDLSITFPSSLYGVSFNSKMIHALLRKKSLMRIADLTNWIDLEKFNHRFSMKNSREYYSQSLRNNLRFSLLKTKEERISAYDLIAENRTVNTRPIYMSFDDLCEIDRLWPVDYFGVFSDKVLVASAVFYRFAGHIVYAVFWGDNISGRPLRAMDFISFNLWEHYKGMGFRFVDMGVSTESGGIPNEGLLRFKEAHEANTELRYTFGFNGSE